MKTFDEMFPSPIHTQSFLWALGWGEMVEGLPLSEQLWSHDALGPGWGRNFGDVELDTKEAVAESRKFIERLTKEEDERWLSIVRQHYHEYRLNADDEYKADYQLNQRILRAMQDGLFVVTPTPSARQVEAARACYETRNLFGELA